MRGLATFLVCALVSLSGQNLSGRRAPSFSLPDSSLKQHDLLDYRQSFLIVDFMKTDCPHCKAVSKTLEQAKARHGSKLAILEIVMYPPETTATVAKYIVENKVTVPILFDSGQVANSYFAAKSNSSYDTPHLFAVDPWGMIVKDWNQAAADSPSLAKDIDQLVSGVKK